MNSDIHPPNMIHNISEKGTPLKIYPTEYLLTMRSEESLSLKKSFIETTIQVD